MGSTVVPHKKEVARVTRATFLPWTGPVRFGLEIARSGPVLDPCLTRATFLPWTGPRPDSPVSGLPRPIWSSVRASALIQSAARSGPGLNYTPSLPDGPLGDFLFRVFFATCFFPIYCSFLGLLLTY